MLIVNWCWPWLSCVKCPRGLRGGGGWWLCACTWLWFGFCGWGDKWCGPPAQWGRRPHTVPTPTASPTAPSFATLYVETMLLYIWHQRIIFSNFSVTRFRYASNFLDLLLIFFSFFFILNFELQFCLCSSRFSMSLAPQLISYSRNS